MEEEGERNQRGRDGCIASETSNGKEGERETEEIDEGGDDKHFYF